MCVVYPIVVVKAIDVIMGRGDPSKPPTPSPHLPNWPLWWGLCYIYTAWSFWRESGVFNTWKWRSYFHWNQNTNKWRFVTGSSWYYRCFSRAAWLQPAFHVSSNVSKHYFMHYILILCFNDCSCPLDLNLKGFSPLLRIQFQLPFMCWLLYYFGTGIVPRVCISDLVTKIWEVGKKSVETWLFTGIYICIIILIKWH